MTNRRSQTFFEGGYNGVKHVGMHDPYCNNLRKLLKIYARKLGITFKKDSVYACTEGPRFETKAEIKMMKLIGADVVGMTSVPEVVLAKELGICYASIGFIVNMATGIVKNSFEDHKLKKVVRIQKKNVNRLFLEIFSNSIQSKNCSCGNSIINL